MTDATTRTPETRADRRFNFAACSIDAIGWPLGYVFFSSTTVLPVFLSHLNVNNLGIGLLTALINLLVTLPGLLVVRHVSRLKRVRGYLFGVALLERFALLPLAPLTVWWGIAHPHRLIVAVFGCFIFHGLMMGINQSAYFTLIGKVIPPRWRGRLFGYASGIGGILGIGNEWFFRHIVFAGANEGFPVGFSRGFLIGFVILTVSVLPLAVVREPETDVIAPMQANESGAAWRLLRTHHAFRYFLIAQALFMMAAVAAPFFVLYAGRVLHADGGAVAVYTAVSIFAGAFGSLMWGWLGDRLGNRIVLVAAASLAIAAILLAIFANHPVWYYGVFALSSLATAGGGIAGNNIVIEFAGETRNIPLYTTLFNATNALPRTAAPLLGGLLADTLGYRTLFWVALAFSVLSLLLTLRIHEPRHIDS